MDEIRTKFQQKCKGDIGNPAICGIQTLIEMIENTNWSTVNNMVEELQQAANIISEIDGKSKLAVTSACAQFLRFATLTLSTTESGGMSIVKKRMADEGRKYLKKCEMAKHRIAQIGSPFVFDGARVLVHSDSSVVLETLKAVPENIIFSIILSAERDYEIYKKSLQNASVELINEKEIGYRLESIDLVLIGAEAIVKNGGILNTVGTLSLAICAKEMNKPLYVLAESFKFSLLYPLNQSDLPKKYRYGKDGRVRIDYTPPKYITLVVTDRGLLTPTAVCDELVEMYV